MLWKVVDDKESTFIFHRLLLKCDDDDDVCKNSKFTFFYNIKRDRYIYIKIDNIAKSASGKEPLYHIGGVVAG